MELLAQRDTEAMCFIKMQLNRYFYGFRLVARPQNTAKYHQTFNSYQYLQKSFLPLYPLQTLHPSHGIDCIVHPAFLLLQFLPGPCYPAPSFYAVKANQFVLNFIQAHYTCTFCPRGTPSTAVFGLEKHEMAWKYCHFYSIKMRVNGPSTDASGITSTAVEGFAYDVASSGNVCFKSCGDNQPAQQNDEVFNAPAENCAVLSQTEKKCRICTGSSVALKFSPQALKNRALGILHFFKTSTLHLAAYQKFSITQQISVDTSCRNKFQNRIAFDLSVPIISISCKNWNTKHIFIS